jgi:hypothetical protein
MCSRAQNREAFAKPLLALGANRQIIAEARSADGKDGRHPVNPRR